MKYFLPVLFCLLLVACSNNEVKNTIDKGNFINIPTTVKADLNSFKAQKLVKTIVLDGKSETKTIDNPDWATELALFYNIDIDKPALWDNYTIEKEGTTTSYTTENPKMTIKKVVVQNNDIYIEKQSDNFLYKTYERLSWLPKSKTYNIVSERKVLFGDVQNIVIEGVIE